MKQEDLDKILVAFQESVKNLIEQVTGQDAEMYQALIDEALDDFKTDVKRAA